MIAERVAQCGRPLKSFDDAFRTALDFLANPWKLWLFGSIAEKRAAVRLTFGEGLTYVRGGGYRTALSSSPFRVLSNLNGGEEEMVRLQDSPLVLRTLNLHEIFIVAYRVAPAWPRPGSRSGIGTEPTR